MTFTKPAMKMPEFLVSVRLFVIGVAGAEVFRVAFYLGANWAPALSGVAPCIKVIGILLVLLICSTYAMKRGAHSTAAKICRSHRLDLLIATGIGVWTNGLISPWLTRAHVAIKNSDPHWAPTILALLCAVLLPPLVRVYLSKPKNAPAQLYFIADEEIKNDKDDVLASDAQANSFAETVLASGAHPGLIFGVDGPWGVGKSSFINLVQRYWSKAENPPLVCRFEPLRYASEPDLTDRLIRDLSAEIQREVFAPEFRPAASRYSRLIKGKADVSFLGFKLSLEPSQETIDELLDDIDEVLRRIGRRVIIVVDDLDRLDVKTINNVLFATRRTFKLSQATYVLCYDTEILAGSKDEGSRAREFLEKFVTVKLSLFVDSSRIRDFLLKDWQSEENNLGTVPADTMLKLSAVLNELAEILDGDMAARYLPLVGDLRKVKRFVNAMLLMQIEKSDLGRTDFNKRDLINLMLLHLHYPRLFRQIYAEETEGRSGSFSVQREPGDPDFQNSEDFSKIVEEHQGTAGFLLTELFDVERNLVLAHLGDINEAALRSRALFNHDSFRNLEGYLKLIVRFATPEPQETFVLYQKAVEEVRKGASVASVLSSPDFSSERWEYAHDQFWRLLVNQSYDFTQRVTEDAIETLIAYLPRYPSLDRNDRGLRQRSVYSLLILLDRAGWGRTAGRRLPNSPENVIEVAWRIFGEDSYQGKGMLQRLTLADRGVLGWNDLMLFRLSCSADRQGQLFNLQSALIVHQDKNAERSGSLNSIALLGMRKLSQEVFTLFKRTYIDSRNNFFSEVDDAPKEAFLGQASSQFSHALADHQSEYDAVSLTQRILSERSTIKSFVIYQLSNTIPPSGSGVGCGYYDEFGLSDGHGIAKLMNEYVFGFCFNPDIHEGNIFHFLNYCLSHLSSSFFSGEEENGWVATKTELIGGLDPIEMGHYWRQHQERIRQRVEEIEDRNVYTPNYIASYRDDLPGVFTVLDELAAETVGD